MKKMKNVVEVLSSVQTSGDLWDEFNEEDFNPKSAIVIMNDNIRHSFRLLGPFIHVSRFYCSELTSLGSDFRDSIDINGIADHDETAINNAKTILNGLKEQLIIPDVAYNSAITYLNTVGQKMTWQRCIAVNALFTEPAHYKGLKILLLTRTMCKAIFQAIPDANTIINGISACSLHMTKIEENNSGLTGVETANRGYYRASQGSQRRYRQPQHRQITPSNFLVEIDNPTTLSQGCLSYIIKHGLYDISSLFKELNKNAKAFYYKVNGDKYKMPKELNNTLFEGMTKKEENKHLDYAERFIHELPIEAFEKHKKINSPIISLDLED